MTTKRQPMDNIHLRLGLQGTFAADVPVYIEVNGDFYAPVKVDSDDQGNPIIRAIYLDDVESIKDYNHTSHGRVILDAACSNCSKDITDETAVHICVECAGSGDKDAQT